MLEPFVIVLEMHKFGVLFILEAIACGCPVIIQIGSVHPSV